MSIERMRAEGNRDFKGREGAHLRASCGLAILDRVDGGLACERVVPVSVPAISDGARRRRGSEGKYK